MALTFTPGGTGNSTSAGTTLASVQLGTTFAVGDHLVVFVAADNAGAAGNAANIASLTATGFGSINEAQNAWYDNGAASAGSEIAIYTAVCTSARIATDTITVNFTNSLTSKTCVIWKVTAAAGEVPSIISSGVNTGSTTGTPTMTTGTVPVGGGCIGGVANESNASVTGDADTTNGNWSAIHQQTANTGTVATSMRIATQAKVQTTTASTQTYNPTMTSCDTVGGWISFGIGAAPAPAVLAATITMPAPTLNLGQTPTAAPIVVTATPPTAEARGGSAPAPAPIAVRVVTTQGTWRSRMRPENSTGFTAGNTFSNFASYAYVATEDVAKRYTEAEDTAGVGLWFKSDGTKMFILGDTNNSVFQYTLSTPWDPSTATYDTVSFSVAGQTTAPTGVAFSDDGLWLYITFALSVAQYRCATAWSLASVTHKVTKSISGLTPETSSIRNIVWNPTGTKFFTFGIGTDRVLQFNVTIPWEIETAAYYCATPARAGAETNEGMCFVDDGYTLLLYGNGSLGQTWILHTAYDLADCSRIPRPVPAPVINGLYAKSDSSKIFGLNTTVVRALDPGVPASDNFAKVTSKRNADVTNTSYIEFTATGTQESGRLILGPPNVQFQAAALTTPAFGNISSAVLRVRISRAGLTTGTISALAEVRNNSNVTISDQVVVFAAGSSDLTDQTFEIPVTGITDTTKATWDAGINVYLQFDRSVNNEGTIRIHSVELDTIWTSEAEQAARPSASGSSSPDPIALPITIPQATAQADSGATPTPATVALVATLPAVEARAGSTPTVSPIAVPVTLPAVDAGAGAVPTVSPISLPVTLPAAEARAGSTPTAAPITLPVTIPQADAQAGSMPTAAAIALAVTVPAAEALAGATGSPSPIALPVTLPAAAAQAGSTPAVSPIAVPVTVPAVTAQAGAGTSPSPLATFLSMGQVEARVGSTLAPSPIAIAVSIPQAEARAGSTVAPAVLSALVTIPQASPQAGATPTPDPVLVVVTIPPVTASGSDSSVASPDPVLLAITVPQAEARAGSTPAPTTLLATVTIPQADARAGAAVAPATVNLIVTIPQATPQAGSITAPSPILLPLTLPAVAATAAASASPTPITVPVTMPQAEARAGSTISPDAIFMPITLPTVSATGGSASTANPGPINVLVSIPQVSAQGSATPTPTTLAVTVTIPAVQAQAGSTLAPQTINLVITVPQAAAKAGAGASTTPISVLTDMPATSQTAGAGPAPSPIVMPLTLPAPFGQAGSTIDVATLLATIVLPAVLAQVFNFTIPDGPYETTGYAGPRRTELIARAVFTTASYGTGRGTDGYPGPRRASGYAGPRRSGP